MQLFIISELHKKGSQIFLPNVPDLLSQLRKVLRTKIGDIIFVQPKDSEITRYEVKITNRTDKDLEGEIISEQFHLDENQPTGLTMLIAMPNKREKTELIVQKLSEIGVNEILFRPAERSVIKQRPTSPQQGVVTPGKATPGKIARLLKIAQEATEQSRGVHIPKIAWCDDVKDVCKGKKVVVFDKGGTDNVGTFHQNVQTVGVIGPEGGLTKNDYTNFPEAEIVHLGESILRMETAAIVGGRLLRNRLF